MEDTKETVKDRAVNAVRRNKVRIAYYTAGAVAGTASLALYKGARNAQWAKQVRDAIETSGEYVTNSKSGLYKVVITKTTES